MIQYGNMGSSRNYLFPWIQEINSTATHGTNSSERNPEDSQETPYWANENKPISIYIGKAETHSYQKPHPLCNDIREGIHSSQLLHEAADAICMFSLWPTQSRTVFNIAPYDYNKQMIINRLSPRAQCRGDRQNWLFQVSPKNRYI